MSLSLMGWINGEAWSMSKPLICLTGKWFWQQFSMYFKSINMRVLYLYNIPMKFYSSSSEQTTKAKILLWRSTHIFQIKAGKTKQFKMRLHQIKTLVYEEFTNFENYRLTLISNGNNYTDTLAPFLYNAIPHVAGCGGFLLTDVLQNSWLAMWEYRQWGSECQHKMVDMPAL